MANQVAARLSGDDYQHLFGWYHLLELLMPERLLQSVTIEDPDAGAADDITLRYRPEAEQAARFLQVKYHVDHRGEYSTESLLACEGARRSLIQKLHDTWRTLGGDTGRALEIHLVSNWRWGGDDGVRACIGGRDHALRESFFTAGPRSAVGRARERWRQHLGFDGEELAAFARSLRLRVGFDSLEVLEQRVQERMQAVHLRHDRAALHAGRGIVRDLVQTRRVRLEHDDVDRLVDQHRLRLPSTAEAAVTVYLNTVQDQRFDLPPDHLLDWREHFAGDAHRKGHRVLDPAVWNGTMLPELIALERHIGTTSTARLIRARGLARLSPWIAFGHTFSEVARYTIEVDQQGRLWRTDARPSELQTIERRRAHFPEGDPSAVAAAISVSGCLEREVEKHLKATHLAATAVFLQPNRKLGPGCLSSAGDAAALAITTKERLRSLVAEHGARRLLLYYSGPLSGACFLGHRLNAVAPEIQVMEHQQPGYAPAFLLR